jgi:MFS family permease
MQRTAVSWVVYDMTHSTWMLGLTVFATNFPSFVFSLFGGILSDRYNRYKLLLITQVASLLQALILSVITLTNKYTVWEILWLSVILGIINAFDVPIRQPLIHELVKDKSDIPNALALNSSMVNVARIAGPALSGIILQSFGAGTCFLLNTISFIAVIGSLLLLRLPPYVSQPQNKKISAELREGFLYLRNTPSISMVLLMLTLVSFFVLPYETLLPVFARDIYGGDAKTFGYIRSFIGVGAISGTFYLASLKKGADLKKVLLVSTFVLGVGLMLFSEISSFPLAMVFAVIAGFGVMAQNTICLTIVQVEADKRMRGRVISFLAMAMFGMLPIGSLILGMVSRYTGAPLAIFFEGVIALVIGLLFVKILRRRRMEKTEVALLEENEELVIEKL